MPSTKQQGSTHLFGMRRENLYTLATFTAWKVSKYGVISGPYFPVFGLNTGRYGPEIAPYLDTFHAVNFKFQIYYEYDSP